MKKILLMLCIIMGVAAGCASTGNEKNEDMKVNPGEIMEHEQMGR